MHLGLVGAIVAFLLSVFWKPQIGLYYLVPLLPMQTIRYWIHGLPFGEKLVDVLLLGVVIGLLFKGERPLLTSSPINILITLFSVILYISLWQGSFFLNAPLPLTVEDPRFSNWKNYVEMMFLFFVAVAAIRTPKQIGLVVLLMCLSVLAVNRSYRSNIAGRDYSQYSDAIREAGVLGYAGENGMGAFQAEFCVFLLGFGAYVKKKSHKIAIWVLAATCIYCLLLTFSRGAYAGFMVGLLTLGIIKERKFLIAVLIILVSWQSLVPNAVTQRVLMTYEKKQGLDESAQERVSIWQDALLVIQHDPILGTGFDTYRYMGRVGPYTDTHNYYLRVALELGLLGLLVFFCFLGAAIRLSWKLFRKAKDPILRGLGCGLVAMLLCAAVVNFFGDRWSYLQVTGFFWVLLGMAARGLALTDKEDAIGSDHSVEFNSDAKLGNSARDSRRELTTVAGRPIDCALLIQTSGIGGSVTEKAARTDEAPTEVRRSELAATPEK